MSLPGEIAADQVSVLVSRVAGRRLEDRPLFSGEPDLAEAGAARVCCSMGRARVPAAAGKYQRPIALALIGLMAVSPWVLFLSTALLSETLFAAALTGALLLLGHIERGQRSWKAAVGVGLLASAAFLTRTIGVVAVMTGGLILWQRGSRKQAAVFGLICA